MEAEQKQTLIAKIESLSTQEQQEVVDHVECLLKKKETKQSKSGINLEELRGTLSHLKDEYTIEELKERAKEWRMQKAVDY